MLASNGRRWFVPRVQVRKQKGIGGSLVTDLLSVCCCYCCALTQEAQEVDAIGSLNMVRQ